MIRALARLLRAAGLLLLMLPGLAAAEELCRYQTWAWDTLEKRAVNHARVEKPYAQLSSAEVDPLTGCSVCERDQREIHLPSLAPFRVCHVLAAKVEDALRRLLASGEPIGTVIGYRVGLTRGEVDANGLRTGFSNHSFGIAIDINPEFNGLYDNCAEFGASCRLIRGGAWVPGRPGSITADGAIVAEFERIGLRWGGRIAGRQKDFMHFSPAGY